VHEQEWPDVSGSGQSFCFFLQAPELEPLSIDRFFDRITLEIMGRGFVGPDHAGSSPGTEVFWEFVST
jgi:hypothetical protein